MLSARPRVLLVGVVADVAAALHAALMHEADLVQVTAEEVLALVGRPATGPRPTSVVVIGWELRAPVGLIHALRPNGVDLAVIVVSTSATEAKLATLPLLFSDDQTRQVPGAQADQLPAVVRQLLEAMTRQGRYAAVRAAAQRQLAAGASISRQLGEQLFGEFLTQAPVGAVMLDGTGGLAAWNHKAADVLGLTEPDCLGRALTALFPPPTQTRLRQRLDNGGDIDAVFERTRRDGTLQALRLASQQVSDAQGVERTLVLVEDVTDRVQAQRELAERTSHALLSADVAAAMTAPGTVSQHLHRCVRAIVDRLGATSAHIWTTEQRDDLLTLTAGAGTDHDEPPTQVRLGQSLIGEIAAQRRPTVRTRPPGPADDHAPVFAAYPLVFRDELMGVLSLTTRDGSGADTLAALAGIADLIAVGIQQDRLVQRLSNTAATLQHSLLPPVLPDLPRVALAARYLAGAEGVEAGGDWYDVLDLEPDHVALVVGDVVGQGAAAAAVMGQLRSALAAYLLQGQAPAQALQHLNRFTARVPEARASTVTVMILNTGTGELRWACAGHLPPLVIDTEGRPCFLEDGRGPCLGVSNQLPFREGKTHIAPRACVLLCSDGLIERRGEDIDDGLERLAAITTELCAATPPLIADRLLEHMLAGCGRADDVALVIARLLPPPLQVTVPALATELPAVRRRVRTWSAQGRLPEDLTDDLVQSVDEATANCVEHAYPDGPGPIEIELSYTAGGRITARVTDFGRWRPPPADKGYRGRGLELMHKLSKSADIEPRPAGTTVRLQFAEPRDDLPAGNRRFPA
jgi:PAS domain S-box-containing protein